MEFEISLRNVRFYSYHGVMEEETRLGNEFMVDLSVCTDVNKTISTDNLECTISYAELFEIVKEKMEEPCKLLEKVCLLIAEEIKSRFPMVKRGSVSIEKVRPPIHEMLGSALVKLNF